MSKFEPTRVLCPLEKGSFVEVDKFSPMSPLLRVAITSKLPILQGKMSIGIGLDVNGAKELRDALDQWIEERRGEGCR